MFGMITKKQQQERAVRKVELEIEQQKKTSEKAEAQALFTAIMTDTVLEDSEEEQ